MELLIGALSIMFGFLLGTVAAFITVGILYTLGKIVEYVIAYFRSPHV